MTMTARILLNDDLRVIESQNMALDPPLMQRAGVAAASVAREMLQAREGTPLIVAGPGNNGGDAFVVARKLLESGIRPVVLFDGNPQELPQDAHHAHAQWQASNGQCIPSFPADRPGLIVDGLFGIGLKRPIEGQYAEWIARINAADCPVLALDIPSGLNAETGIAHGACVRATRTATFITLKPGLLTADGPDLCGDITLCELGINPGNAGGQLITPSSFSHALTPRLRNSHKGSFGSAVIIGGAPGMVGAALLAGRAALKLGAGRVYLGLLDDLHLDPLQPELMIRPPAEALSYATAIGIGPGLGQTGGASEWVSRAMDCALPLVIDADALNLLAQDRTLQNKLAVRPASTFLTPHPTETARLLGTTTSQIQSNRLHAARELALRFKCHVILKGCGTIVAYPDRRWFINSNGNPGLASAGSGDVLTGILTALLAQGYTEDMAPLCATHVHAAAADACVAIGHGPIGLTAGELIDPARQLINRWTE